MLGFVQRNNSACFYDFQATMDSELWIRLVDDFIDKNTTYELKTVIVVDNASTHKANITILKIQEWAKKNVFIHYLKPYCSALNPIEIVWRFFKHKWINVLDYLSKEHLMTAIDSIVHGFGKQYRIDFE